MRWDQKVIIQLFQSMVMLHIKFKGITNAAAWGWVQKVEIQVSSEHGHVAYQI